MAVHREPAARWNARIGALLPYRVNMDGDAATGNPAVRFMHCLPALHDRDTRMGQAIYDRRGLDALVVTDEVFESPAPIGSDQAGNRLHTIEALVVAPAGDAR